MNVFAIALLFSLGLLTLLVALGFALYREMAPSLRQCRTRQRRSPEMPLATAIRNRQGHRSMRSELLRFEPLR